MTVSIPSCCPVTLSQATCSWPTAVTSFWNGAAWESGTLHDLSPPQGRSDEGGAAALREALGADDEVGPARARPRAGHPAALSTTTAPTPLAVDARTLNAPVRRNGQLPHPTQASLRNALHPRGSAYVRVQAITAGDQVSNLQYFRSSTTG